MKKILSLSLTLALALSALFAQAQTYRGSLNEEGQIVTETVQSQSTLSSRDGLAPMPGFPQSFASNTTYKPMRGVTLADLDGDGADEIILNHNEQVNVIKGDGSILWTATLTGGMAQYPASVADLDNDGHLEVVALCAYGNARGGFNIFNYDGTTRFALQTDNNPLICAPTLADINNDGNLEVVFCGRGRAAQGVAAGIHVWDINGNEIAGFPFELPSTPAFTPTVADINGDGNLEIFACTTSILYCISNTGVELYSIDGQDAYKYSYQSPLVVDLDGNGEYSLVGACHGDGNPNHYVRNAATGEYRQGWPKTVSSWTYSAPTVVKNGDAYNIYAGVSGEGDVFYQYDADGNITPGFPLNLTSGIEGFVSVADLNNDGQNEIITTFNLMENGNGFIRAWNLDGTEYTNGFPLRPEGLSYMNGANLGDINGDGLLEAVVLTYVQNFSPEDPVMVTAYALNVPVENLVYGCYKGSNDRMGWIREQETPIICNPVQNLRAEFDTEQNQIIVRWDAPENGSTGNLLGYKLYKNNVMVTEELIQQEGYEDTEFAEFQSYEYYVTAVYDDGCESSCEPVVLELGDLSVAESHFGIYPNPVNNILHIQGDVQSIVIYNVTGQKVFSQEDGASEINLENLHDGIYFLLLQSSTTNKQVKIIIEH